jgi:hypothetical protein
MSFNKNNNAPCGMNCGICMAYLRKKNKCNGCKASNTWNPKTRVECKIKNCSLLNISGREFCYECKNYPCKILKNMDARYRTKYKMSVIENLEHIKNFGFELFQKSETEKWKCKVCGGVICVHKNICYDCGKEK